MKQVLINEIDFWVRDDQGGLGLWDRTIAYEVQQHYQFVHYPSIKRVMDIGAHIGAYGRYVRHHNPSVGYIGIEPDPDNHRLAVMNMPLPSIVIPGYCGYDETPRIMLQSMDNSGNHRVAPAGTIPRGEWVMGDLVVERYTIEDLFDFAKWDTADLLKIDCEGSEYDILANAPFDTLRRFRYLIGEYHGGGDLFRAQLETRLERVFQMQQFFEAPDWGQFFMERRYE